MRNGWSLASSLDGNFPLAVPVLHFLLWNLKVWFVGWWDLHWVFTGLLLRSIFRIGNVPTWWEGRSQLDLDSNRSFATRQTVSYLSAMTNCVGGITAELLFESLSKFSNSKLHRSTSPPNQENICDENFSQASKGYSVGVFGHWSHRNSSQDLSVTISPVTAFDGKFCRGENSLGGKNWLLVCRRKWLWVKRGWMEGFFLPGGIQLSIRLGFKEQEEQARAFSCWVDVGQAPVLFAFRKWKCSSVIALLLLPSWEDRQSGLSGNILERGRKAKI